MNYKHGRRHSKAWRAWSAMRNRCNNPNNAAFANYGGRGISVSKDWESFQVFHADMGDPEDHQMLERVDNNKGYSKENCIWADRVTQNRNRRGNVLITMDGETLPLSAWAERYGLKYTTASMRIAKGWPPEKAIKTPVITDRRGVPRGSRFFK